MYVDTLSTADPEDSVLVMHQSRSLTTTVTGVNNASQQGPTAWSVQQIILYLLQCCSSVCDRSSHICSILVLKHKDTAMKQKMVHKNHTIWSQLM